ALAAQRSREAVSSARAALAHYRGDLLPDDPYEPWAVAARERLRRHALALLDLCAASAASAGDLDEAVRCLERAIEMAPDRRSATSARPGTCSPRAAAGPRGPWWRGPGGCSASSGSARPRPCSSWSSRFARHRVASA